MNRFEELLFGYREGLLDSDGRDELACWIELFADCRRAFVEVLSEQRIRRMALRRG